jgi:hypothetical protein
MSEATEALELIQIDHTLADVMIVDSGCRQGNGLGGSQPLLAP